MTKRSIAAPLLVGAAAVLTVAACAGPSPGSSGASAVLAVAKPGLEDSSWRLFKIEAANDQAIYPPDPSAITLTFKAGGALVARVDCNRGGGTWSSSAPGKVSFGPLSLTKMGCPSPGLGERFARDLSDVKSYATRDGRLFLSVTRDGTIYVMEPVQ